MRPPRFLAVTSGAALVGSFLWHSQRRGYAATPYERAMPLPGDELLPTADVQRTFGRNLRVAPEALWPWVIQMGQERGGFYSYAALENLVGCRIVNADQVQPQWQQVRAGDDFHLHPDLALRVALVDPPHALVVRSERPPARRGRPGLRLLVGLPRRRRGDGVAAAGPGALRLPEPGRAGGGAGDGPGHRGDDPRDAARPGPADLRHVSAAGARATMDR